MNELQPPNPTVEGDARKRSAPLAFRWAGRGDDMLALKVIQSILGIVVTFYLLKGLLGKFGDGDMTKAVLGLLAFLGLSLVTSGVVKVF